MFKHSHKIVLSADIGGSHVSTGLIRLDTLEVITGSILQSRLDAKAAPDVILMEGLKPAFQAAIEAISGYKEPYELAALAIAMPGPFDYQRGIFRLSGLDKYGNLYGVDFKRFLYDSLSLDARLPIFFKNDADAFGLGAYATHVGENRIQALNNGALENGLEVNKMIAITLGTGLGSAFVQDGQTLERGKEVPDGGHLYNQPLQFAMKTEDFEDAGLQEGLFSYGISEELISTRGLLQYVNNRVFEVKAAPEENRPLNNVKDLAELAKSASGLSELALEAFKVMGFGLGTCLKPWYDKFKPATLVLGGGIAQAADLFLPSLKRALGLGINPVKIAGDESGRDGVAAEQHMAQTPVNIIILDKEQMQVTPLIGVAYALKQELECQNKPHDEHALLDAQWRSTHQALLPQTVADDLLNAAQSKQYNIFPFHKIGQGKIQAGYSSLATQLFAMVQGASANASVIALDGYTGVDWVSLQAGLAAAFNSMGVSATWIDMASFARTSEQIEKLIEPYLGRPGAVWGTRTDLHLTDLFDHGHIKTGLTAKHLQQFNSDLVIIYGTGAGLAGPDIPVAFVELPKNEIQYRMRAGKADNLLTNLKPAYSERYKRAYFVDWPMLDDYRARLMASIQVVIDGQWRTQVHWSLKEDLVSAFKQLALQPLRVRPWFAPGAWGGDWMKHHFKQLSREEVNYAWSFELIVPENGIVLESDGLLLELPFDMLMASQASAILGADSQHFGHYFPIRFDFLDTFNGGNLSIQCHPSLPYIKEQFGEMITQDETYYILDTKPGAGVYLGFQQDIEPEGFRLALESSQSENKAIDIEQYVQLLPAKKHDLFLIPNQTVHSAGANNLVLEISATPYIFTFKMYDWVRPDLNGKPRPINIEHAFHNLDFNRKGEAVQEELVSQPQLLSAGNDYWIWDLPTHVEHFYGIRRLEFMSGLDQGVDKAAREAIKAGEAPEKIQAVMDLSGKCQIMMVVEGPGVILEIHDDRLDSHLKRSYFSYAETFIIPASVIHYRLIHPGSKQAGLEQTEHHDEQAIAPVKVIQAFIK